MYFGRYNLTAYKNAAMQIRFGLKVDSGGAYTVGITTSAERWPFWKASRVARIAVSW